MTSTLLPLHRSGLGKNTSNRAPISESSMPTTFQLLDISEDKKFLALIDDEFKLQAYKINVSENNIVIGQQTMKDISCNIDAGNSMFVYISIASETGHVAISFLQTNKYPIKDGDVGKTKTDKRYTDCKIYRAGKAQAMEIPFQGRAAFTKDKLVLIGLTMLEIYDAKTFKKAYLFIPKPARFNFESYNSDDYFNRNQSWFKQYPLMGESVGAFTNGNMIASISEHIRKGVIVEYRSAIVVNIWSIFTGSLICSFRRSVGEHVTFISEDNYFLVTNDVHGKSFNIFFMESGAHLCTYQPQSSKPSSDKSTVLFVKFMARQSYMLIMGTVTKQDEEPHKDSRLFFDIFSIEQQRRIKYRERDASITLGSCFPVDIFREDGFSNSGTDGSVYFPSKFYGVFLKNASNNTPGRIFTQISLIDPEPNGLTDKLLWNKFSCRLMSAKSSVNDSMNILDDRLDSDEGIAWYLFQGITHSYILRFSKEVMQLWKLVASEDEEEGERLNFGGPNYYSNTTNSTLIYTRGYNGIEMQIFTATGDTWKAELMAVNVSKTVYIYFTKDEGRILVYCKLSDGNEIVDEIFLPLPTLKIQPKLLSTVIPDKMSYDTTSDDFHNIESCLLALRNMKIYSNQCKEATSRTIPSLLDDKFKVISKKTMVLLTSVVSSTGSTNYFKTMSASSILMDLVDLDEGKDVIIDIILENKCKLSILNHPTDENILTALLRKREYELFQILFNQAILDYYNGHSDNLFPLMNAILWLEKKNVPGLLLKCIDNLSYLPVHFAENAPFPMQFHEIGHKGPFNWATKFYRVKKHNSDSVNVIPPTKNRSEEVLTSLLFSTEAKSVFTFYYICIVPLPTSKVYDVISYTILTRNSSYSRNNPLHDTLTQKNPIIEALLLHRWKNNIKRAYYTMFFIQTLFYIFYTISVSFPEEIFGYTPGSPFQHAGHIACLVIAFLTWNTFWLLEAKQMFDLKKKYWKSFYNYIDLLASFLPLVTFILLRLNSPHLYDISSLTSLVLCVHLIMRLRVRRRMGILIEIIIQLGMRIAPVLGLMILLLFSFTYSFIVLLRRQDDSFFQEQYKGDVIPANNNALGSDVELSDQSQQNLFKDVFLAFSTVWFFLYGVFDPILSGDVGNNPMALVLAIMFTFITSLVILNVVIALMAGAIDETEKWGNRNWHIHLADVIHEIESIMPRFIKNDIGKYVHYFASKKDVELQHEKLENETKKMKEKILKDRGRKEKEGYMKLGGRA